MWASLRIARDFTYRIKRKIWHCLSCITKTNFELSIEASGRKNIELERRRNECNQIWYWKTSPISVAALFKGVVLRPIARWDRGFESRIMHGNLSPVIVVWCHVEISASGWSLVQRRPTACGVSKRDSEASTMGRPWPTSGVAAPWKVGTCNEHIWRPLRTKCAGLPGVLIRP